MALTPAVHLCLSKSLLTLSLHSVFLYFDENYLLLQVIATSVYCFHVLCRIKHFQVQVQVQVHILKTGPLCFYRYIYDIAQILFNGNSRIVLACHLFHNFLAQDIMENSYFDPVRPKFGYNRCVLLSFTISCIRITAHLSKNTAINVNNGFVYIVLNNNVAFWENSYFIAISIKVAVLDNTDNLRSKNYQLII